MEVRRIPLTEHFIRALFDRFRPFKVRENSSQIELSIEMDITDFLVAITLLSTIPTDSKFKRKYNFCSFIVISDVWTLLHRRWWLHDSVPDPVNAPTSWATFLPWITADRYTFTDPAEQRGWLESRKQFPFVDGCHAQSRMQKNL